MTYNGGILGGVVAAVAQHGAMFITIAWCSWSGPSDGPVLVQLSLRVVCCSQPKPTSTLLDGLRARRALLLCDKAFAAREGLGRRESGVSPLQKALHALSCHERTWRDTIVHGLAAEVEYLTKAETARHSDHDTDTVVLRAACVYVAGLHPTTSNCSLCIS